MTFTDKLRQQIERVAGAKRRRAESMIREGERLIVKGKAALEQVQCYLDEVDPASSRRDDARRAALFDAQWLEGAVDPLSPDLPAASVEALQGEVDRLRALVADPQTIGPEAIREVASHLLMVRQHLARAREDLAVRLHASPLREIHEPTVFTGPLLGKIRERVSRVALVGANVSKADLGAVLHRAFVPALGWIAAGQLLADWPRQWRSWTDKPPVHDRRPGPWGHTLQPKTSLAATSGCEALLREVFPRVRRLQQDIIAQHLPIKEAAETLQAWVRGFIVHAAQKLGRSEKHLDARVQSIMNPQGAGLRVEFVLPEDADRDLLESVLRELSAEHKETE